MRGTLWWTTVAASALVLAACGSQTEDGDPDPDPDPDRSAPDGQYLLAEELSYLPAVDGDQLITVHASDFERVGEILGDEKPTGADTDIDELMDWIRAATLPSDDRSSALATMLPRNLGWAQHATNTTVIDEGLGVSLRQVTRFAEVHVPPTGATVVHGEFETDRITAAIGEPEDGVWSIGEELVQDLEQTDVLPPVGAGLRIAETDDRLLLFRQQDPLRQVVSGGPSLADDEDLLAVAQALDSAGWYSAMLVSADTLSGSPAGDLALEPFTALGASVDVVDGEDVIHLAYAHDAAETAEENEAKVTTLVDEGTLITGQPVNERLELLDTQVDDTVLIVTLKPIDSAPGVVWNMIAQRDVLTSHR